ncbi:hypothetical protein COM59_32700, partial [Bacillus pseudomycoides]
SFPSILSWYGMFVIMLGMIAHSYVSHKGETVHNQNISA